MNEEKESEKKCMLWRQMIIGYISFSGENMDHLRVKKYGKCLLLSLSLSLSLPFSLSISLSYIFISLSFSLQ